MNRVERVNIACLAAIILVLTLLLGSYVQPANSAPAAPLPTATATEPVADESSEPSGVRGLTVAQLEADAWESYRSTFPTEPAPSGQFTTAPEYFAAYEGSAPQFTPGYFAIESHNLPGLFHAFHMVAAQRA